MKRLFAAIKIPVEPELEKLVEELQQQTKHDRIKWVNLENLHLTLKFFGETPEDRIDDICKQLDAATKVGCPFTMNINRIGVFGSSYKPRLLWLGIGDHPDLFQLWKNIIENLKTIDIHSDRQNFVPHITLGRINKLVDKKKFSSSIETLKTSYQKDVFVNGISLYNSTLAPEGPVYDVIQKFEFKQ
ncbi:MAG: RNA 2',3'-cyclic phosphodiesterase [Bacteroidales bacterium]|nr:RNA 2',3'-cyclic phosphodiesterase [Bacteroidales bacterium]